MFPHVGVEVVGSPAVRLLRQNRPGDMLECTNRLTFEGLEDDEIEVLEMIRTFDRTGGVLPEPEFVRLSVTAAGCPGPAYALVRERRVVSFVWGDTRFFPAFQFSLPGVQVREGVGAVLRELASVLDEDDLCRWFGRSNSWIGGLKPAELVGCAPTMVLQAARVDRFIFRG